MGEEVGNRICGRSPVLSDGSLWKLKGVTWMRQEKVADLCGSCSQAPLLLGSKEQALHVKMFRVCANHIGPSVGGSPIPRPR